jgi:cell division septum initiation protein DivIVA
LARREAMTHDDLERAIEFVLAQQAKSNGETDDLRATVNRLAGTVAELSTTVAELSTTVKAVIEEMREGFNNLIVANEVTRDLASKTAELAVNTARRVTRIERELKIE